MADPSSIKLAAVMATALLVVFGLIVLGTALSTKMEIDLASQVLAGNTVTAEEAMSNDQRQKVAGWIYLGGLVVAAAGFLVWLYMVTSRLDAVGPLGEYSPGWALGWWFIPVAWLWKPYQVMAEVWARCHAGEERPRWFLAWWGLWIAANLVGWLVTGSAWSVGSGVTVEAAMENIIILDVTSLIADAMLLVSGGLTVLLVWRITKTTASR